jgi:hypothetical protein
MHSIVALTVLIATITLPWNSRCQHTAEAVDDG